MMLIIGSNALNFYRTNPKPPKDFDAIADYDTASAFLKAEGCAHIYPINDGETLFGMNNERIYEIEIAWPGSTGEALLKYIEQHDDHSGAIPSDTYIPMVTPSLNVLYALKMSHR